MKRGGCSQLLYTALRSYASRRGRIQTASAVSAQAARIKLLVTTLVPVRSAQTSLQGRR